MKGFDEATWSPDNKALKAVTDTNGTNVKASENGGSLPVLAGLRCSSPLGPRQPDRHDVERQGDLEARDNHCHERRTVLQGLIDRPPA